MEDVAGFKNPRVGNATAFKKAMRYVVATTAVNSIFEDVLNIQSPLPSPINAFLEASENGELPAGIAAAVIREMVEPVPYVGGIKFGSSMLGILDDTASEVASILKPGPMDPKIGTKEHLIQTAELIAKLRGVPGVGQETKSRKAAKRGESLFGTILGSYTKGKGGKGLQGLSGLGGLSGL